MPTFPVFSPQGTQRMLLSPVVADVNSDGFDDVLATDVQRGDAVIADGRANARFQPETVVTGQRRVGNEFPIDPGLTGVTAADVNEDGKRDLVASAGNRILIRYATTPVPGVRTGSASPPRPSTTTGSSPATATARPTAATAPSGPARRPRRRAAASRRSTPRVPGSPCRRRARSDARSSSRTVSG
jgi:VCBS repeat protein